MQAVQLLESKSKLIKAGLSLLLRCMITQGDSLLCNAGTMRSSVMSIFCCRLISPGEASSRVSAVKAAVATVIDVIA
jgi:hypothetical protein